MFRYSEVRQGGTKQGQHDADAVQQRLVTLAEHANVQFYKTDLITDGGNYVDDFAGNVVINRKFLRDNKLSEQQARKIIRELSGA